MWLKIQNKDKDGTGLRHMRGHARAGDVTSDIWTHDTLKSIRTSEILTLLVAHRLIAPRTKNARVDECCTALHVH